MVPIGVAICLFVQGLTRTCTSSLLWCSEDLYGAGGGGAPRVALDRCKSVGHLLEMLERGVALRRPCHVSREFFLRVVKLGDMGAMLDWLRASPVGHSFADKKKMKR